MFTVYAKFADALTDTDYYPKSRHCDRNLKTCPPVNVAIADTFFVARIPARAHRDEPSVVECLWCA